VTAIAIAIAIVMARADAIATETGIVPAGGRSAARAARALEIASGSVIRIATPPAKPREPTRHRDRARPRSGR
jgi:hypothetical protein